MRRSGSGAEAIPRGTGHSGMPTVLLACGSSTYMIVLARRHAILWHGFREAGRVGRIPSRLFSSCVAGLAGVSSRRATRRGVGVRELRSVVGVVRGSRRRVCVVESRPRRWWTGIMIHYRTSMSSDRSGAISAEWQADRLQQTEKTDRKNRQQNQQKQPGYIIQDIVHQSKRRRLKNCRAKTGRVGPSPWYGFRSERGGGLTLGVLRVHLNVLRSTRRREGGIWTVES